MKINLPNQITIARLLMSIVFFAVLSQFSFRDDPPRYWLLDLAGWLFVIAALSDVLDGYLARMQGQVTAFGRVIDPFVDKVLTGGAFIFLAGSSFAMDGRQLSCVTPWMVVLILGRELLVTGLRGFSEAHGAAFGANVFGKTKMLLQSFTVGWVLFTLAHREGALAAEFFATMRFVLVWATVIVTFLSLVGYVHGVRAILAETSRPAETP
jgi:CDP-diacylglycerol--glycerol-3-phosphate 3-phosphatidyltransferase